MKNKKTLSLLLSFIFAFILIAPFAMKPQSAYALCYNHKWGSWQIGTKATCKAQGTKVRYCQNKNCKAKQTVYTSKTDHSWTNLVVDRKATCETNGSQHKTCKVCGKTTTSTINKLGHLNYSNWKTQKAATCSSNGVEVNVCARSNCNAILGTRAIYKDPKYHNFVTYKTYKKCSICGATDAVTTYYNASDNQAFHILGDKNLICMKGNINSTDVTSKQTLMPYGDKDTIGKWDFKDVFNLQPQQTIDVDVFKENGMKLKYNGDGTVDAYLYFKKNEIETFMADPEHYSGSEPDWYIYAKGKVESNNDITLYPASWYKSGINEDNKKQTVTLKFN